MGSFDTVPYYKGRPVYDNVEAWWALVEETVHWSETPWTFPPDNELDTFMADPAGIIETVVGRTGGTYYNTWAERIVVVPEGVLVLHDNQCGEGLEWMLLDPAKKVGDYRPRGGSALADQLAAWRRVKEPA